MISFKHGLGKMTYASGNSYEGYWERDNKSGEGTMNWEGTVETAPEKYYGSWKDNLQNGFGTHIWVDSKGEGKFLRNRYSG